MAPPQTAPVRRREIVAENYLSYGIFTLVASGVLITAIIWALNVPMLGSFVPLAATVGLLLLASLGIGFIISLLASNEQTAAQLAMIILLAAIFLGGFIQPLELIIPPVRVISFLLPSTYGVQLFQDIVVRGEQGNPLYYAALGLIALLGLILTTQLFRRQLRPT